jgi:hypothetical protein
LHREARRDPDEEQRITAKRQPASSLFLVRRTAFAPGFSVENEGSLADNFLKKQQKQREAGLKTIARYLSVVRVIAAHARGGRI